MAHFIDTKWQLRSLPVAVCSDDETGLAAGGASGSRGRTCDLLRDMLPDLIHRGAIALATGERHLPLSCCCAHAGVWPPCLHACAHPSVRCAQTPP